MNMDEDYVRINDDDIDNLSHVLIRSVREKKNYFVSLSLIDLCVSNSLNISLTELKTIKIAGKKPHAQMRSLFTM